MVLQSIFFGTIFFQYVFKSRHHVAFGSFTLNNEEKSRDYPAPPGFLLKLLVEISQTAWLSFRLVFKCGSPHLNANANAQNDSNANANSNAEHFNQMQMQMQVRSI